MLKCKFMVFLYVLLFYTIYDKYLVFKLILFSIGACQSAKIQLLTVLLSATEEGKEIESEVILKRDILQEALKATTPLLSNPDTMKKFYQFQR